MKKTLVLILVSVIAAIIVGWAIARYRITHPPYDVQALTECIKPKVGPLRPILQIEPLYNFGVLQNGEIGNHRFVLKNAGKGDLTVTIVESGCKCTTAELEKDVVKPGESTFIDVTWKTADYIGDFVQKVLIQTNDPDMMNVELEVHGKIVADARAVPSEMSISNITHGNSAQTETQIACYKNPPLEITGYDFLDPKAKNSFDVQIAPLTEDEYKSEPDATGGYRLTLNVKGNLPMGPFSETLVLKTNSSFQPEIKIPIHGTVSGNISVAGNGWNKDSKIWVLSVLEQGKVGKRTLSIFDRSVKTVNRDNLKPGEIPSHINLEVESVTPNWLQVELEKPKFLESGVVQTNMVLTVPADAPVCNYWDYQGEMGKIILKTSSEEEKSILINIRFAVTTKQE